MRENRKQFTMQIEACEGTDAAARNRFLHRSQLVYFLILIDELLANAAGDYLLKGKSLEYFESHSSRLDVLAAHTDRNQVIFTYKEASLRGKVSWRTSSVLPEDPDLGMGRRRQRL